LTDLNAKLKAWSLWTLIRPGTTWQVRILLRRAPSVLSGSTVAASVSAKVYPPGVGASSWLVKLGRLSSGIPDQTVRDS
jgi:hypothetical protein